jgi:hypothetical protein
MAYTSPNAPEVVDVLGTWLLSILDGQRAKNDFSVYSEDRWSAHVTSQKPWA